MRLLTRYVLVEVIKVFAITLTAMTLFMILVSIAREAYSQGLGLKQILLLLPYVLPEALRFSVPGTILFATCSVYGRMASTNEIVAIKASGISPWSILWPVFVFAFLLSIGAVVLNDLACSWGRDGARRVVIESVEEIAYSRLAQQHSYSNGKQFSINVKRVDGRRLVSPTFTLATGDDGGSITVICEEAELRSDLERNTLSLLCRKGRANIGNVWVEFDTQEFQIQLDDASRRSTRGASDLAMSQVPQEVAASHERIDQLQEKMTLLAVEQMATGEFGPSGLSGSQWSADERRLMEERVRLYRLVIEPARRWSNGFSCLCFVLIGAPAGIILRNSDFLTSFFACFLPILLVYYPLLFLGVDQAKLGILPPWSVWTGNVILAVAGAWLIRRVYRY
ncbi:MAG TPA: LptF/LptG family permease [Pirellulales bacterium]|nr:LptF/LptG family permease [Pirellulales bacterium]